MQAALMIEVRELTRRYGDFVAVDGVSFEIADGDIVGLLGHNGAGKTTIMKMLTGYLEPSGGGAWIDGIEVEADRQAAQARLGYLPESLPLYPEMTVADYLAYVANLRAVPARPAVRMAIEQTELGEKAHAPIATLSRGFKQRVGVAQAILHAPQVLILDEPTNGLDPAQTAQMRALIQRLAENATVILSTHIMQEVDAVCDRALILRGGTLVLDERLSDLRRARALRLRCAPDSALAPALENLAGIDRVEVLEPGVHQLSLAAGGDGADEVDAQAAAVAQLCAQRQVAVYELAPQRRDLERVFREANEG
ncbi:MAG: ABC transporter ATP-binding protein [Pseudomonadota bacterium]